MRTYRLEIKDEVFDDIQNGIDYYNSGITGLGRRFFAAVQHEYKAIVKNPFFQVRYENVRCVPIRKFPCMIHFIVEEEKKRIVVIGIINTYLDPQKWIKRYLDEEDS
jgi:toxin ParE1/3/4